MKDEDLKTFVAANDGNGAVEVKLFLHRGFPYARLDCTRTEEGIHITDEKFNLNVPLENSETQKLLFPAVGEKLELRFVKAEPVFWIAVKFPVVERKPKEKRVKKKKKKSTEQKEDEEEEKQMETETGEKENDGEKTKKDSRKVKRKEVNKKFWKKIRGAKKGKNSNSKNITGEKRKRTNEEKNTKKEKKVKLASDLIETIAKQNDDKHFESLKESVKRVKEFDQKLEKKTYLSKKKKRQIKRSMQTFEDLESGGKRDKKEAKNRRKKRVKFSES